MLPFLKNRDEASSSEPIPHQMRESDDDDLDDYDEMESVAEDLIKAIKSDSIKGIAEALRSAFEIYEAGPHVEGPHLNEKEE
jgi:hypothetical protein